MRNVLTISALAALALVASRPTAAAELELPALSPLARVMQTVGVSQATIEYSSPGVKGRTIYGGLVPYDELWRTGANAATKLTLTDDAMIGGQTIPAGTYAIFTIPTRDEWTVILNENENQGGTGSYDSALDVLRMRVKPERAPVRERMTFLFSNTTNDSTDLQLWWDDRIVTIPITFDTTANVARNVMTYSSDVGSRLARAARAMTETGNEVRAMELVNASIAADETWYNTWTKAEMLAEQGHRAEALRFARRAWELGQESDSFFYRDRVKQAIDEWSGSN